MTSMLLIMPRASWSRMWQWWTVRPAMPVKGMTSWSRARTRSVVPVAAAERGGVGEASARGRRFAGDGELGLVRTACYSGCDAADTGYGEESATGPTRARSGVHRLSGGA